VSGGATSVGMFVIQLARIAGFRVIASASPRSFDLVKSYGAEHVVSYADHKAALQEIHAVTGGGVNIAVDCVGGKPNVRCAVDAFGKDGGVLTSILPGGKSHRSDVIFKDILLYRYLGKVGLDMLSVNPLISRHSHSFPSLPNIPPSLRSGPSLRISPIASPS
jgi:NADPH:quinone reductase-like Zn-dependent oxidoreductase